MKSLAALFVLLLAGCSAENHAQSSAAPSAAPSVPSPSAPAASSPSAPGQQPAEAEPAWAGTYVFSECAEGGPGSTPCWAYEVAVREDGGASVHVDGFQTLLRMTASTEIRGEELAVRLEEIGAESVHPPALKRGDELLTLKKGPGGAVLRFSALTSPIRSKELRQDASP